MRLDPPMQLHCWGTIRIGAPAIVNIHASLQNAGNTCYLNATLHVLARIPLLRNWFRQHVQKWQRPHSRFNCFLCAIGRDVERLCGQGHFPGFIPEIVDLRSHWSHEQFAGKRQHDVTEMLSLLFDSLNTIDETAAAAINPALMQPTNPSRFTILM